jgi:hypothetical protein
VIGDASRASSADERQQERFLGVQPILGLIEDDG